MSEKDVTWHFGALFLALQWSPQIPDMLYLNLHPCTLKSLNYIEHRSWEGLCLFHKLNESLITSYVFKGQRATTRQPAKIGVF